MISAIRLPIRWPLLGFGASFEISGVAVADGSPAWAWEEEAPSLGIDTFPTPSGTPTVDGWGVDHVVLLVPDLDLAILEIQDVGHQLRRRATVRDQPAAFFEVGPTLEVIETGVPEPRLYGVALWAAFSLASVAERWQAAGLAVAGPSPAIQTGREILVVKGLDAGLAVMNLEGEV